MAYEYRRRRPSIVRNFWVYRRLIGSAVLLGLMLWFIWANNDAVTVLFPFRLGQLKSTAGVAILLGALVGSLLTFLIMTFLTTMKRLRAPQALPEQHKAHEVNEDRPPPDYAAKTTEGFSNAPWSG
jgi:uncharacterized integral membrane protein